MCLTIIKSPCDLVALSYVWGPPSASRLLTQRLNLEKLSRPGSLSGILPRTIGDAGKFACQLGFRYLWVDALCIVQDDDMENDRLINQMHQIYNAAVATIVAYPGHHADDPLPGISQARNLTLNRVEVMASQQRRIYLSKPRVYALTGSPW